MTDFKIFDSSGAIRYPEQSGDLDDESREEIRDLFFNSVYVKSDEGTISMYFKASTGTPEQFIGAIPTPGGDDPVGLACDQLVTGVKSGLGWSIADSEASEGQQVFSKLANTSALAVDRYPIDTLRKATDNSTIDIGTPGIESAVGVLKWLVRKDPAEWSVAIGGDGRTQYLSDIDIVIVPGATDQEAVGINGSDEYLQNLFIEDMADQTSDLVNNTIKEGNKFKHRQQKTLILLEWLISEFGLRDYLAEPRRFIQRNKRSQMKLGGAVIGIVGLGIGLLINGGLNHFGLWWAETILGGDAVQFSTVATLTAAADISLPPIAPVSIVVVTAIFSVLWGVAGGVVWSRMRDNEDQQVLEPTATEPPHDFTNRMDTIIGKVQSTPGVSKTAFADTLASKTAELPAGVTFLSKTAEKKNRLLFVGLISLASGVAGGLIGYGISGFLPTILEYWLPIAETVVLLTVLAMVAGSGMFAWVKLFR